VLSPPIVFQAVDWPITRTQALYHVGAVQSTTIGVFDPNKNHRVDTAVAMVMLRRSFD